MPRKKIVKSNTLPYHVYNRTNDREFYPLEMPQVWKIYCDAARIISWAYGAKIHALVLMSNHYHLMLTTPDSNIDKIMEYFQSFVSREIRKETQLKRYRFTSRYRWKLVSNTSYYANLYRYINRNPVMAGLCSHPENYLWSSFAGKFGVNRLEFPVCHHDYLAGDLDNIDNEYEWVHAQMDGKLVFEIQKTMWRQDVQTVCAQ